MRVSGLWKHGSERWLVEFNLMYDAGLTFLRRNRGRIKLGWPAVHKIQAYLQNKSTTPESGGILLGRFLLECDDVVVDEASAPMKGDKWGRYFFHRDRKLHQRLIDEAWVKSNGTCAYLGEWHSHPEADPNPSTVDLDDWRRKLRTDRFDGDHLFFVIAGVKRIRIWEGDKRDASFKELPAVRKE
jgi:integrative and conjugative element protein (TIGR02256 family)